MDDSRRNIGGSDILSNASGRASQATGMFNLKTGIEPQIHTDSHRYSWSSERIGWHRKLRTVGRLYSFIRVHLRSSVVKIRGLGLVTPLPRRVHPRDSRETIRGCRRSSQDRNRQTEDGAPIAIAGRVVGTDDRISPVAGSSRQATPAAETQTNSPASSVTAPA